MGVTYKFSRSDELSFDSGFAKIVLTALTILLLGELGAIILCLWCIKLVFKSTDDGLKALILIFLIFLVNPVLFNNPITSLVSLLRVSVIVLFAFLILSKYYKLILHIRYIKLLVLFSIVALITSLFSSYEITLSISKLLQFILFSVPLLLAFLTSGLSKQAWIDRLYTMYVIVLLASLPFYMIPDIGMARNGVGFQGITNHPQVFSVFIAPFLGLIILNIFISRYKSYFNILIFILSLIVLILTQGRTGAVALFLGLMLIILIGVFKYRDDIRLFILSIFKPLPLILIISLSVVMILNIEFINDVVYGFVNKNRGNITESVELSRGTQIELQLENISNNTLLGIGFGLPSTSNNFEIVRAPYIDIPISAPVEKGFLFLSVIEEAGFIGGFFFYLFLFSLLQKIISNRIDITLLGLTALLTNIGEASLFSSGGIGVLIWMLIGISTIHHKPRPIIELKQKHNYAF